MGDWRKHIVRQGYDATAGAFAAARGPGAEQAWLQRFAGELAPGAAVLDLGMRRCWSRRGRLGRGLARRRVP